MAQDSKSNASNGAKGANGASSNGGSHQGSTATLLGMQHNHEAQNYQSLEDYTASLAILEEQNRRRRHAASEDRHRYQQTNGSSGPSPSSPRSANSNGHSYWPASTVDQSQNAIQQYQQMLLEEQRRRNQELGGNA